MHNDAIRVAKIKFRTAIRRTAKFFTTHSYPRLHCSGLSTGLNTVFRKNLHNSFIIEIIYSETQVGNSWIITGITAQCYELRPVTNLQNYRAALACCNRHTEQTLIPLQ
ncbi:uncharacterized protein METZ01_LOCUS57477 [marine metagenome]|uniref:Uncharacterized protein n=1 Tax=marine metagenome TaxID=408172 RepID=A0A381STI6_9ZZZZ